ncbi:MAG: hypothetical protein BGO67_08520 [Alphaproteobacteria bacterium 41-28]|nr:MAG: hypothetical protein BGO67_08520 [Alphaproteobacteria bacterium 41-28]
MSLHEHIKSWFRPESASRIRKLQFLWAYLLLFGVLIVFYGALLFFFNQKSPAKNDTEKKIQPTSIETASKKVDLNEVWRHGVEEDNKRLSEKISALETLFQESLKEKEDSQQTTLQDLETKILQLETDLEQRKQDSLPQETSETFSQNSENRTESENKGIQKFSLSLSKTAHQQLPKTVDTTIPAGAFAKTVLLSGLDASSSMSASSDPRPMLLRLIDPGTLPRRFQSDLKDCHCLASAYGDLSSERIYARLEKLTCIERATGEIIETQVAGYIAGSDGKAGIRGVVASKDGQFLGRSLLGGVFAGLSNVANPQNRQAQVNPFAPGSAQISPPNVGEIFTSGMASGATTALDRLSQYYIDRAEQLQPVIQVSSGQVVDIVFTEGTFIGAQNVKTNIEKTREESRREESRTSSTSQEGE